MSGPAGGRPDLIAEVFDDEPPNESATRVTLGEPLDVAATDALIHRFMAGEISAREMVDGLRQHRCQDPLSKPKPLTTLERAQAAVRRINRGRQAMADESGKRLEPVERRELREGDEAELVCVYRGRVQIDGYGNPYVSRASHTEARYGSDADSHTWHRVVADPPLPTTPGLPSELWSVIVCDLDYREAPRGPHVTGENIVAQLTDRGWMSIGSNHRIPADGITRVQHVLAVYPEPGGER